MFVLIFSSFTAPAISASGPAAQFLVSPPSESRTQYNLTVNLDYEKASLTAKESVVYTNTTSVDLGSIVFNVTPAEFNAFTLNSAAIEGKKVTPAMDGVVMELPLPQVLPKGKSTTIDLDFRVNVPRRGGRLGVGDGVIALGNWFPILGVYSDARTSSNGRTPGWSKHQYVEVGDAFFTETADYSVTVDTSSPVTIAHTGTLVRKDADRWQIQAKGVRDFGMAISNRYQTQSRSIDGVVISAYYLPEHAALAPQYLEAAALAVERLNRLVMPYPYPTLGVAEIYAQSSIAMGQEYSNLAFISSNASDLGGGIDSYLAYLVMHEVTHQWFYGLVGNDQVYDPWLDEALATWYAYHIVRITNPSLFPAIWQTRLLDLLAESIRKNGDSPVDRGIYDFADELHYYNIVYRKGTLFIEDLHKTMGDQSFFDAMKDYATTFRERIATPVAFFDLFQSHTSANLSPIIAKYFSYDQYRSRAPLSVSVDFPAGETWSGTVKPKINSTSPITEVKVFVEDSLVWSGNSATDAAIDTAGLRNGEDYLLTVKVTSAGRTIERARRFSVSNDPKKVPTPNSSAPAPGVVDDKPSSGVGKGFADLIGATGWLGWAALAVALGLLLGIAHAIRRAR